MILNHLDEQVTQKRSPVGIRLSKLHYAWVILLVSFVGIFAAQGIRLSFGAFMEPWQSQFRADRGTLSLVSMVSFVVFGVSQPLFGKLVDTFGVRKMLSLNLLLVGLTTVLTSFVTTTWQLLILYGVISSIGFGGTSGVIASVAITNWFQEKRGLAFGLLEAAFGAGQMIIVPLSLFLIGRYGWKTTVVMMGLFLIVIVFPLVLLLMRSHPADHKLLPYGVTAVEEAQEVKESEPQKVSLAHIMRQSSFWFLVLPFFVCGFTTTGLMDTHLIPFCLDMGFSNTVTGAAVSTLAAFNIVGILISGRLADRSNNRLILAGLYTIRALSMLILMFTDQTQWLLGFSILFGLVDFATVAPTQLLATQYFKGSSVGLILGWISLSHQIGSALGSYLPGLIYSWNGSYYLSFSIAIVLLVFAAVFSVLLPATGKVKTQAV